MAADNDKLKASAINPVQARTHALNIEGVFFQQLVADVVRQAGWTVKAQEYPVAFPKGNGPILGREGRLDIRAERQFEEYRTILAMECKKADPDYKDWVFFPQGASRIKAVVVRLTKVSEAPDTAAGYGKWRIGGAIAEFTTGEVCIDARELKAAYGKPDSWKSSTKRIDEACYQAAQATQALNAEITERQNRLLSASMEPEVTSWVVPVVVTTANLLLCRFRPQDVSLDSGEIDWNQVKYDPVDVIVLEYPLPIHLQLPPAEPLKMDPSDTATFTKKHVFVVRSTSAKNFLQAADLGASLS